MTRSRLPGRADSPGPGDDILDDGPDDGLAAADDAPGGEAGPVSCPDVSRGLDPEGLEAAGEPDPSEFLIGAEAVRAFVAREWKRQLDYRLKKEVWTYSGDQVSILFEYEWLDAESDRWISTYGEEHWEIAPDGLLRRLSASGRDIVVDEINP